MREIQVKTFYPDLLRDMQISVNQFSNLINNETVIMFSLNKGESLLIYQKDNDHINLLHLNTNELIESLKYNKVEANLEKLNLPTNYTLIKIDGRKFNCSNIFVSDASNLGYDVCLFRDEQFGYEWDIEKKIFPKVKNQSIQLGESKCE